VSSRVVSTVGTTHRTIHTLLILALAKKCGRHCVSLLRDVLFGGHYRARPLSCFVTWHESSRVFCAQFGVRTCPKINPRAGSPSHSGEQMVGVSSPAGVRCLIGGTWVIGAD